MSDENTLTPIKADASLHLEPADFTRIQRSRFLELIITDYSGEVLGGWSGESDSLAILLRKVSEEAPKGCVDVVKKSDSLTPLGQDIYRVARSFLLGARETMWGWEGIHELEKVLPMECNCTFLVNY